MNRTPLVRLSSFLAILFLLLPGNMQAQGSAPGGAVQPLKPAGPPTPTGQGQVTGPEDFGWDTTLIDFPHQPNTLGVHSLALDSQGYPHILYGSSQLYYASFNGARWEIETLDRAQDSGNAPSLALDAAGRPHIVYTFGSLNYLYYDGTDWQRQVIDSSPEGYTIVDSDLTLDAFGAPHVGYTTSGPNFTSDLRYAYLSGTVWITETAESGWQHRSDVSIALDSAGRPHISYNYWYSSQGDLKYASYDGTTWVIETVDAGPAGFQAGKGGSLAIDSADHPHIGYSVRDAAGTAHSIKYAYYDGTTWNKEIIETGASVGAQVPLALGPTDQPCIAYQSSSVYKYATQEGGTWNSEIIDVNTGGYKGSLVIDPAGLPHVSYIRSESESYLWYAYSDGTIWQNTLVDYSHGTGFMPALALDSAGQPHVSYCQAQNSCQVLRYGEYNGTEWQFQQVAHTRGNRAGGPSMALIAGEQPLLTYIDDDQHALRYAYLNGLDWITATVEHLTGTLSVPSLAVNSSGQVGVAYLYTNGYYRYELHYATYDGFTWTVQTAYTITGYSEFLSLAIDSQGHPHVAYVSTAGAEDPVLFYATYDGTIWTAETIEASTGGRPSLALDSAGRPHVSYSGYSENSSRSLKYASLEGTTWRAETVDSTSSANDHTLVLDAGDHPHIVYVTYSQNAIRYAYNDGGGWRVEAVAGALESISVKMALDGNRRPHVLFSTNYEYRPELSYTVRRVSWTPLPWTIEDVDAGNDFSLLSNQNVAIDGAGHPHVAYGGNHLHYAWHDGSKWRYQVVDWAENVGAYATLVLDQAGYPHIIYQGMGGANLRYAYYDGQNWLIQLRPIMCTGEGIGTSLAIDPAGTLHLTYRDTCTGRLGYARYSGGEWLTEEVDGSTGGIIWTSLALDSAGRPHISYCSGSGNQCKYAYYDGTVWRLQSIGSEPNSYTSLALDSAGRPHVSYFEQPSNILVHAYLDSTNWITESVDDSVLGGRYTTLLLDSEDRPRLSYADYGRVLIKYAYYDGVSWQNTVVGGSWLWDPVYFASLALDAAGNPYVGYEDPPNFRFALASWDGQNWDVAAVDRCCEVNWYTSLVLDGNARPHIASFGREAGARYSYHDGRSWCQESIDQDIAEGGGYTSLAVDADNVPHVSYAGGQGRGLEYASRYGEVWTSQTVEAGRNDQYTGRYSSLAMEANGRPHIAYCVSQYPMQGCLIRYASYNGTRWLTETVGSTAGDSADISLALDSNGQPHMTYWDEGEYHLHYAYQEGTVWFIYEVPLDVNYHASLALDSLDRPHIAYVSLQRQLLYAYLDGETWITDTVNPHDSLWGNSIHLVLDAADRPHIAYEDDDHSIFKYAFYDGTSWHVEQVDPQHGSGYHASLQLDPSGRPHIAYSQSDGIRYAYICQATDAIDILGPGTVLPGYSQVYTASLNPPDVTAPFITWDKGTTGATAVYSWTVPGVYTLTVTATNGCSEVSSTLTVLVQCEPLEATSIAGPALLLPGETGLYSATYAPLTATQPVTFTWSNSALGPTTAYSWTLPGLYTVTVTAANACGQATAEWGVEVEGPAYNVYLPLVFKAKQP